ncbi:MAG: response regulator [Anaerolineae bacterium]|nr:response regulator [Anaerolineae bacterium]
MLHLTQGGFSSLSKGKGKQRHLLILADERTRAVQVVRSAFQTRGWIVDTMDPTTEALGSIKRWLYDLVIIQITQPDIGDFALCEALRQRSRVPLLLIVSPAVSREIISAFHKGADAYVVEPFDLRELLARAEALLRRAEKRLL